MLTTISRDKQIERANEFLGPRTRKPATPHERLPRLYNTPRKSDPFATQATPLEKSIPSRASSAANQHADLQRALKILLGQYLENTPREKRYSRGEVREFMANMNVCLGAAPGKLSCSQYFKLFLIYDHITSRLSGDLQASVALLDNVIDNYQPLGR